MENKDRYTNVLRPLSGKLADTYGGLHPLLGEGPRQRSLIRQC